MKLKKRERFFSENLIIIFFEIITIVCCILPMNLSDIWTGKVDYSIGWRQLTEYDDLAQSILNGHVDIDSDVLDKKLETLENPYDWQQRDAVGAKLCWDRAYYNGHLYMYFGIVPVFLLFLPYRIITGNALPCYRATQIFTIFIVCGIFALLKKLWKKYFQNVNISVYLACCISTSAISLWYIVSAPGIYCMAIASGICMELWSLNFFVKAVFIENDYRKQIRFAFIGSVFGALTIGCRPPVALANLLIIPMLILFIREHSFTKKIFKDLIIAAIPYIIVCALLGFYNYIRFDSPFEFGQSYQLTSADQRHLDGFFASFDAKNFLSQFINILFAPMKTQQVTFSNGMTISYLGFSGVFFEFPVLILSLLIFIKPVNKYLKENKILGFVYTLFFLPFIIITAIIMNSPFVTERYKCDFIFLIAINTALLIMCLIHLIKSEKLRKIFSALILIISIFTILKSVLLFLVPNDFNWTFNNADNLYKVLHFF